MEIVSIFAGRLFTVHYENQKYNEYDRLMDLWTDTEYLMAFAERNNINEGMRFVYEIRENAQAIDDFFNEGNMYQKIGDYFKPLDDTEISEKLLSPQKGRIKGGKLRLYALKIDTGGPFLITGGAIKITHQMRQHSDTRSELTKINTARFFLKNENIFDLDSFYEFLIDQDYDQ